ncbi:hypothetical protein Fmac_025229 [Flemingia macrophylla]|uniref:ZP domain-containing protein n=1 Tax=Flemingia macrophylla TaxID=520843 RepID=A0ABD1LRL4_9FABA
MYGSMNQIILSENNNIRIQDITTDSVYPIDITVHDSSQLTFSFRGQVYVQAMLLLLGGSELNSGSQCAQMSSQNHTGAPNGILVSLDHCLVSLDKLNLELDRLPKLYNVGFGLIEQVSTYVCT